MRKTLLIHHDADFDGTLSASIILDHYHILKSTSKFRVVGYNYQKSGTVYEKIRTYLQQNYENIIMVDVTLTDELMNLIRPEQSLLIIDHHKSEFERISNFVSKKENAEYVYGEKSACYLTWKHYNPTKDVPEVIMYASMYDAFDKSGTNEFTFDEIVKYQYGLRSLFIRPTDIIGSHKIIPDAVAVKNMGDVAINTITTHFASTAKEGHFIPLPKEELMFIVNAPKFDTIWAEKIGNPATLIVVYQITKDKICFSLRKTDASQCDCSKICKHFGGGGHRGAAGFSLPFVKDSSMHTTLNEIIECVKSQLEE